MAARNGGLAAGGNGVGGNARRFDADNPAGQGNRERTRTEGSRSSNALRFLERSTPSHQSSGSSPSLTGENPWPVGYDASQAAARPRAWTLQSQRPPRLPRNSPLAFLERAPTSASVTSIVTTGGADVGLGSLSGGFVATSSGRDGLMSWPQEDPESGSDGSREDEDDNVCPSMLFSCFPCLACFRPGKRRRPSEGASLEGPSMMKDSFRSQTSLSTPLLSDQPPSPTEFPKDVKLIEVEVESARNLPLGDKVSMAELAGTYVSLRVTPVQEGVGEQTENTSIATRVANPRWGGGETFTFFVTDTNNAKAFLALRLLCRPLRPWSPPPHRGTALQTNDAPASSRSEDVVIGEGFVDLLGMFPVQHGTYTPGGLKGNSRRVAVPLREPIEKRRIKCSVMLGLRCRRVNETIDTHEDRLYEYQRWTQLAGWSSTTRRRFGTWSTLDGACFSDDFAKVAPCAREDSEVVLPWCPFGGWEYSREEETAAPSRPLDATRQGDIIPDAGSEGWENFAVAQKGAVWMEGYVSGYQAVRRRLWRRVYLDRGSTSVTPLASATS